MLTSGVNGGDASMVSQNYADCIRLIWGDASMVSKHYPELRRECEVMPAWYDTSMSECEVMLAW